MKQSTALFLFLFCAALSAETCTLQTHASSWMVTGTAFSVKCPSGNYTGTLISTPAKRFFRRGHMLLRFDQPVRVQPKRAGDEGKIQPSRARQISSLLISGEVGIGAKDLTDEIALAGFKSWYMIPVSVGTIAFFSNGGDVLLKPGYKL